MIKVKEHKIGTATAEVACDSCYGDGELVHYLTPEQHAVVRTLGNMRGTPNELPTIQAALDLGVTQGVIAHALGMSRGYLSLILQGTRKAEEAE